jgi:hypothetical protein
MYLSEVALGSLNGHTIRLEAWSLTEIVVSLFPSTDMHEKLANLVDVFI